jgi:hypothetical protein
MVAYNKLYVVVLRSTIEIIIPSTHIILYSYRYSFFIVFPSPLASKKLESGGGLVAAAQHTRVKCCW